VGAVQASVKDSVHCVYVCGRTRLCVCARIRINYETMRICNRISTRYVEYPSSESISLSLSVCLSIWTGNIQLLQRWVQGVCAWDYVCHAQLVHERSATKV